MTLEILILSCQFVYFLGKVAQYSICSELICFLIPTKIYTLLRTWITQHVLFNIMFSKNNSKFGLNMSVNSIYNEFMKTIIKTAPKFFSNGTFLCPLGLCCIFPQEYLMLIDCLQYFIVPSKLNPFKSKPEV